MMASLWISLARSAATCASCDTTAPTLSLLLYSQLSIRFPEMHKKMGRRCKYFYWSVEIMRHCVRWLCLSACLSVWVTPTCVQLPAVTACWNRWRCNGKSLSPLAAPAFPRRSLSRQRSDLRVCLQHTSVTLLLYFTHFKHRDVDREECFRCYIWSYFLLLHFITKLLLLFFPHVLHVRINIQ